jgi:hypothetical protein
MTKDDFILGAGSDFGTKDDSFFAGIYIHGKKVGKLEAQTGSKISKVTILGKSREDDCSSPDYCANEFLKWVSETIEGEENDMRL